MGSKVRSHAHYDRSIVNTSVNKIMFNQELYADKNTYLQWYDTYRNGNKFTDGRSYAHVVSCSHPLNGRNVSAGHTARRVHSNPRCQRLPRGSEGQKRHVTTFRPSCKKPTCVSTKSSFSGERITTLSDHDVCNTLPLANIFQVLNEIDDDTPHTNLDVVSPTPCHTAASSSQISHSVMLRQKIRDSSSGLLNQPLTSQFAPADREVSVHNIGFTLSEGNRVTEGEGVSSQMVTDHEFLHRTHRGTFTKDCSDNDLAIHFQTHSKELVNDTQRLEFDLHQLELDLITDPIAETHFSKSFMANKEVLHIIRQQCHYSKDFQLSKMQNGHDIVGCQIF